MCCHEAVTDDLLHPPWVTYVFEAMYLHCPVVPNSPFQSIMIEDSVMHMEIYIFGAICDIIGTYVVYTQCICLMFKVPPVKDMHE